MLDVFKNLAHSEKAVVAIAILAAASTLLALGKIDVDAWQSIVTWIGGAYLVAKGIAGVTLFPPDEPPTAPAV